jgi:hypothetical protein
LAKRFVIATDPLTPDQEKALTQFASQYLWWHWLPNLWLLKDEAGTLKVATIRDQLSAMDQTLRCIVMEVEEKDWAARSSPDSKGNNMVDWIRAHWDRH